MNSAIQQHKFTEWRQDRKQHPNYSDSKEKKYYTEMGEGHSADMNTFTISKPNAIWVPLTLLPVQEWEEMELS
jgi:hypothetical protein